MALRATSKLHLAGSAFAALGLITSQPTFAADWKNTADIHLATEHSDNILNSPVFEEDAFESKARINFGANRDSQQLDLSILLGAEFTMYSGTDILDDEDDQNARFESVYRTSLNSDFSLLATYDRLTYSGSIGDLGSFDEEDGVETEFEVNSDAGFVRGQTRADLIEIRPSFNMQLTARTSLSGIVYYNEADYEDNELLDVFDYEDIDYVGKVNYRLSRERNDAVSLSLGYTDFRSDRDGGNADSERYPIRLEYTRRVSELSYLTVFGGATSVDFASESFEDETIPMYGFIYGREGKLSETQIRIQHHVHPNSDGQLTERQLAQFIYTRETARDQSFGLNLFYTQIEDLGGTENEGGEQDYLAVEPKYTWDIGRKLRLTLSYRYTTVDRNDPGIGEAVSNEFRASMSYRLW